MSTLRVVLVDLLKSFDPGAVEPSHKGAAVFRWLDMALQQALRCHVLRQIATVIGRPEFSTRLQVKYERLTESVNAALWDETSGYYYNVAPEQQTFSLIP